VGARLCPHILKTVPPPLLVIIIIIMRDATLITVKNYKKPAITRVQRPTPAMFL